MLSLVGGGIGDRAKIGLQSIRRTWCKLVTGVFLGECSVFLMPAVSCWIKFRVVESIVLFGAP